ncbi:unnamed protein product [Linum trigynum]|uniref:Uncharacterized protein n=1 Tax=Linum trigynum TaxID=586398 RepID=A0AAV2EEK4_9ROSI
MERKPGCWSGRVLCAGHWNQIWQLNLPPKVRVFAWRWIHNILPTGGNLVDRTRRGCEECPFCGLKETQYHTFLNCGWTRRIWKPSELRGLFSRGEERTCEEWCCEVQESEKSEAIEALLVVLWYIWHERNNHLWNGKKREERDIIPHALEWLSEFQSKQRQSTYLANQRSLRWNPPNPDRLKANVDAAIFRSGGTGWGVIVRDHNGGFRLAAVKRTRRKWAPEIAEAMGIMFALDLAKRYDFTALDVETDCLLLVQKLLREMRSALEVEEVCEEIRDEADRVGDIRILFTGRECNEPAHMLAHTFCPWDSEEIWVSDPPYFLAHHLCKDNNLGSPI